MQPASGRQDVKLSGRLRRWTYSVSATALSNLCIMASFVSAFAGIAKAIIVVLLIVLGGTAAVYYYTYTLFEFAGSRIAIYLSLSTPGSALCVTLNAYIAAWVAAMEYLSMVRSPVLPNTTDTNWQLVLDSLEE